MVDEPSEAGAQAMTPAERYLKALELRRSGLTLREVGQVLGLSAERARQLICRGKREEAKREQIVKSPTWVKA
jgi:orotate phosphoribosyltransferase-like protein